MFPPKNAGGKNQALKCPKQCVPLEFWMVVVCIAQDCPQVQGHGFTSMARAYPPAVSDHNAQPFFSSQSLASTEDHQLSGMGLCQLKEGHFCVLCKKDFT